MTAEAKKVRRLVRDLEASGWTIKPTKKGWRCYAPDGATIVHLHKTPSDHRWEKNALQELRKGGYLDS